MTALLPHAAQGSSPLIQPTAGGAARACPGTAPAEVPPLSGNFPEAVPHASGGLSPKPCRRRVRYTVMTPEREAQAFALAREGVGCRDAAKRMGIGVPALEAWVRRRGGGVFPRGKTGRTKGDPRLRQGARTLTPEQIKDAQDRDLSQADLARELGIPAHAMWRIVRRQNFVLRNAAGTRWAADLAARTVALFADGLAIHEVAEAIGRPADAVAHFARSRGVPVLKDGRHAVCVRMAARSRAVREQDMDTFRANCSKAKKAQYANDPELLARVQGNMAQVRLHARRTLPAISAAQKSEYRILRRKGLGREAALAAVQGQVAPPTGRVTATPPENHPALKLTPADLKLRAALRASHPDGALAQGGGA